MRYYKLNNNILPDNIYWGEINGPTYVYVEITRKCNCKCDFCQVNDAINQNININLYKSIVEQLKKLNCFEIRLGGGEPLLCDDLDEILGISNGLSVWICTNGIKLDKDMCRKLRKHNVVGVRVSLDSLNKNLHNSIRLNEMAFDKAIEGMANAKEEGLTVCLSMTIGAHNIDEIEQVKNFANNNDYKFLTHFIMPTGKGTNFLAKNAIPNQKKIKVMTSGYSSEKNCVAANQSFSIDIEGNVSACTFLSPIANVRKTPLSQIINSNEFNKYKCAIPESENCKDCPFKSTLKDGKCCAKTICKGGCWALYEQNN